MSESLLYADICMGYGGATQGAIDADLIPVFGLDNNPDIVDVAQKNFDHPIIKTDLLAYSKLDFGWKGLKIKYNAPNWLHASLPCTTATIANKKGESQEDIDLAKAVCRAIEILQPQYFSLENVAGYQKYESFDLIKSCLFANDYDHFSYRVLDCSDYGVPQTRKRLFGVFSKKSFNNLLSEIPKVEKKVSWYDAIADLIPTLPECKLTDSQKERIAFADEFKDISYSWLDLDKLPNLAIQNAGNRKKDGEQNHTIRYANEPIWTIRAMSGNVRPNPHQVTLIVDGRVLRPTIQCYARWQSFPDSYQFSGDFKLDMRGIGNAVPPLMFSQIVRSVLSGN